MWSYVFRFKLLVPTTVLEVLIGITVVLWAAGRWQAWRTNPWRPQRPGLQIPTALLLLAGIIGIAVSPEHLGALGIYRAYFIEPVVLFYVAIDLMRTPKDLRTVLLGLAVGTTAFALMNLGAWAIALARHVTIETANAPEALYTSPNAVAMFLEPSVAIAAGFALYSRDRRDRNVAIGSLAVQLPALVLTLSRAGLLTLAVLVIVAVVTMPQTRLKIALLGGALLAAIVIVQIPFVQVRLYRQFDPNYRYNTFEGRLVIWHDTLNMLRARPIFGAGLRAYTKVMEHYITGKRTPELYPHDVWLAMWSEIGLLGLVAFVLLIGTLLWKGWRGYARADGFARPLLWGTAAAFVAITVHGFFDTPYYKNDLAVEFWMVAALEIAALATLARASDQKRRAQALE